MHTTSFVNRIFSKQELECQHCYTVIDEEQTHCHHCKSPVNDEYAKFKQSLNSQQSRAVLMTRLVFAVSVVFALGFLMSS